MVLVGVSNNTLSPAPPPPLSPATGLVTRGRSDRSRNPAGQTGPRGVLRIDFCGGGERRGLAASAGLSPEAQSKQVSEAGHRGTLFALTSVCERAPGEGRLARGPRKERRRGPRPPAEGQSWPRAGGRLPSPLGRQRRGSPAGPGAAARRVLLLGRCRRLQPSSQRRAAPGVKSTFSRSFPHAAPREGSATRARAPPERTLPSGIRGSERKGWWRQKPDRGAQTWESPQSGGRGWRADAGGARPTQFVTRSHSVRRPRRADWHPSFRPCGLGQDTAAPPHISDLLAEVERWSLLHERLKARTRAREARRSGERVTSRTATEGRCPPTIPNNPPMKKMKCSKVKYLIQNTQTLSHRPKTSTQTCCSSKVHDLESCL
ncbi:uncharacterized protein [Castor canadensis]|uniref:Uncharacterized protein n=1 Tax=Castor canadensis TaxID=51338 RepID=A0AC58N1Y7_CASCN